jgi:HSP20 family protein
MANIVRRGAGAPLTTPASTWDPFRVMRELFGWEPFGAAAPSLLGEERGAYIARFDVRETKDGYIFKADLPGIREEDLDISLTGNRLTVSGKRETESVEQTDTYYVSERGHGLFTRTFTLPEGVDGELVKAELKNGVLTLVLPKKPEVQPKKIELKSGEKPKTAKA